MIMIVQWSINVNCQLLLNTPYYAKARFSWSVFWSGFGADFVRALSSPGKALPGEDKARTKSAPGEDKARTKSAPKPLQNTLHGKRALAVKFQPTYKYSMIITIIAGDYYIDCCRVIVLIFTTFI